MNFSAILSAAASFSDLSSLRQGGRFFLCFLVSSKGRMKHSSLVLGFIVAVAVMSLAEAYIASPLALSRASGRLSMGLSARPPKVAPYMQMNPNDKTFRRASAVSLRAEGDENNGPMGRYLFLHACPVFTCIVFHLPGNRNGSKQPRPHNI